jgi:hypothetical protein
MRKLGLSAWHQTTVAKIERPDGSGRYRVLTLPEAFALAFALGMPDVQDLLGSKSAVPPALFVQGQENQMSEFRASLGQAREFFAREFPDDPHLEAIDAAIENGLLALEAMSDDVKKRRVQLYQADDASALIDLLRRLGVNEGEVSDK